MTLSLVPAQTRAILVGGSEFPRDPERLLPLPAVVANVEEFARVLGDPEIIGVPHGNIAAILDEPSFPAVAEAIVGTARDAEDTLLVYYAGHGLVGRFTGELYLAVADTTDADAEYNALPFQSVRRAINEAGARKKILILDCCFSGRAIDEMGSDESLLREKIDVEGTYVMASASSNQAAIAPKDEKHTAFTGELVAALREGLDLDSDGIALRDLFEHVRAKLRKRGGLPDPQRANFHDAEKMVIAHNRRFMTEVKESNDAARETPVETALRKLREELEAELREKILAQRRQEEAEEALRRARDALETRVERMMRGRHPYGLTLRELTVLHLVASGSSDKEISGQLGISSITVSKHVANILAKMNASSRTEAGVRAVKEGLLD